MQHVLGVGFDCLLQVRDGSGYTIKLGDKRGSFGVHFSVCHFISVFDTRLPARICFEAENHSTLRSIDSDRKHTRKLIIVWRLGLSTTPTHSSSF